VADGGIHTGEVSSGFCYVILLMCVCVWLLSV